MNKSPMQWAKAFNTLSTSEDVIVDISLTIDQLKELAIMMEQLALHVSVDAIRETIEIEKSI